MQVVVDGLSERGFAEEVVDDVEALVDGLLVFQWEYEPSAQQSAAHRRHGTVDDVEQRFAVLLHGADQLEGADGKLVQPHIFLFFYAL